MALSIMSRIILICITTNILHRVVDCQLQCEYPYKPQIQHMGHSFADGNSTYGGYRDSKQLTLSPFTVVRFANVDCTSDANLMTGTCYTVWDCVNGVSFFDATVQAAGSCSQGFGTCCTSILGCGGSSNNNNTWLQSPDYPSTFNSGTDCAQTITIEDNICQLRLDIGDLTLDVPDSTGTCSTDYLTVNHDIKFDRLCGVTKDNHFYIDVDYSSSSSVIFSFHTDGSTSYDRSWNIRVTKIHCDSFEEVPRGCGQYYTGTTGIVKGLNYEAPKTSDFIISKLNYAICIRMELGYCKNTYTERNTGGYWVPVCPDIFEWPGRYESMAFTGKCKCDGCGVENAPYSWSHRYQSPHLFKLDTTRGTTNTHLASITSTGTVKDFGGVYHMSYSQTKCDL